MAPRRRLPAVCALALVTAVGLSGCGLLDFPTFPLTKPTQTASAPPTPTASARPTPAPIVPPDLQVGSIVATGQFVGDPRISGDVDVRVTAQGSYELRLINFRSTYDGDVALRWLSEVVQPGEKCAPQVMGVSHGNLPPGDHHEYPFTRADPSFLETVIITHVDFQAAERGCHLPVLASALLTWTLPDMRPGLVLIDSGKTGGANGEVTLLDGSPLTYTVAHNDLAVEVAARLGIAVEDLAFLNPTRRPSVTKSLLKAGEVLNLSRAHR